MKEIDNKFELLKKEDKGFVSASGDGNGSYVCLVG